MTPRLGDAKLPVVTEAAVGKLVIPFQLATETSVSKLMIVAPLLAKERVVRRFAVAVPLPPAKF